MTLLVLGLILFLGVHSTRIFADGWRTATIGKLGETAGLVWLGAPNSPFPEKPHFELADWQQVAGI